MLNIAKVGEVEHASMCSVRCWGPGALGQTHWEGPRSLGLSLSREVGHGNRGKMTETSPYLGDTWSASFLGLVELWQHAREGADCCH